MNIKCLKLKFVHVPVIGTTFQDLAVNSESVVNFAEKLRSLCIVMAPMSFFELSPVATFEND